MENSVVHGLERKRGGGWVHVEIWEETDQICVRVSDNGAGFETEGLDLSAPAATSPDGHNHIALRNIHRRIQLLYGAGYGLTVSGRPGEGTSILVTLPRDEEK